MSLRVADIVGQAVTDSEPKRSDEEPSSELRQTDSPEPELRNDNTPRHSLHFKSGESSKLHDSPQPNDFSPPRAHFRSPPTTPSMRTGPPRTISYVYSVPSSPSVSRNNSKFENGDILPGTDLEGGEYPFTSMDSQFRGALEGGTPTSAGTKGKKRESRLLDESWNPIKWFQESPKEEKPAFEFGAKPETNTADDTTDTADAQGPLSALTDVQEASGSPKVGLRRAHSVPHSPPEKSKAGKIKWGRLRSLIPNQMPVQPPQPSVVTSNAVNITDELIAGGLSTLMLRLWFERDEKDHRRIPVLFHRLRIRISDSLHPLHGHKSVFRIECEYANGAARWVIYRRLRDFFSLHTHYAVSNAYNRNVDNLPEFPRTSVFNVFIYISFQS